MPKSRKASLGPGVTRSIVFDGALGLEDYDDLRRPWAHNGITTSTYTWWNFLPKNLFQQFRKAANLCVRHRLFSPAPSRSRSAGQCLAGLEYLCQSFAPLFCANHQLARLVHGPRPK